jgi:DNA replication protein DnaC
VPYEFRNAVLSNFESLPGNAAAIKVAKEWLAASEGDLYLYGGVGSGKTRLTCSLINELYRQRRTVLFMRISGMLFGLQPHEDGSHERLWQRLVETDVLALDDLASERDEATDFTRRTVLLLYEDRCHQGRRTLWTSNKSLHELSEQLQDERLVSRLAGRAMVVKLTTSDQRVRER